MTEVREAKGRNVGDRRKSKGRILGRPIGGDSEKVKQKLLNAARQLFLSSEFKAVSVRQVAEIAGVNGAMVNYYFGGKRGLYLAMVEQVIGSMEEPLRELQEQRGHSVTDFVSAYMQLLADNPWWPNFMVREVMFGDPELQGVIVDKLNKSMAQRLVKAIDHEKSAGEFRPDLDPGLTTLSLISMAVFPFIARPIAQRILQNNPDSQGIEALIQHTCKLFNTGVGFSVAGEK